MEKDPSALRSHSNRWGEAAYGEWRESARIMFGLSHAVWQALPVEAQTLWENVALAVISVYTRDLPELLDPGRK